jgi:hypothetical protein
MIPQQMKKDLRAEAWNKYFETQTVNALVEYTETLRDIESL